MELSNTIIETILFVIGAFGGGLFLLPPKVAKVINIVGHTAKIVDTVFNKLEKSPTGFKIKDEYLKGDK